MHRIEMNHAAWGYSLDLVTSRRRSAPSHTEGKVWDLLVNGETIQVGFWPEAPLTRGRGLPGLIQSRFPPKKQGAHGGTLQARPAAVAACLSPCSAAYTSFLPCLLILSLSTRSSWLPPLWPAERCWGAAAGLGAVVVLREPPGALAEGDT